MPRKSKRAIAKRRKPVARAKTRTIVKYKYKPRSRRKSVSGFRKDIKSLNNTMIAPVIGTTSVATTRILFPKLKEFIESTPILMSLGYEASMGLVMILLGSLAPRYKKDLYNGAVGPLCIALNEKIDKIALALKIGDAVSGMDFADFEGDVENFTD
jgi:hypothetical protein